jgi:hypothetical protein
MRIPSLPIILAVVAIFGFSASARAQLIFSTQGAPDYTGPGESADAGNAPNPADPYTMAGDVFTSTVSATATNIAFGGSYFDASPTTDNFTLSLYSVSANAPDALLATSVLTASRTIDPNNGSFYNYTASLNTPITLQAGTTYYLGLSNATVAYADWIVTLNEAPNYLTEYSYDAQNDSFVSDPTAQTLFTLSTPEPSSWAMLTVSLGLLAFWRMRKPRATASK